MPATMNEEPAIRQITDSKNRLIEVRIPGALDKLRLFKILGGELAQNAAYLGMALLAYAVISLEGVPIPRPTSENEVEALTERLGDEGLEAVAKILLPEITPDPEVLKKQAGN